MWGLVQIGKVMRRQVRNRNQKMVVKGFLVEEHVAEGEDWKVMTVVDQDTMTRCTLKMIAKSESMAKERKDQIFEQIQNQRKMSGRTNFIDLLQVYEDSSTVYLVMERWGIPLEKVLQRRQTLMENEVQLIFCQLVDILESLKAQNITHGSINLFSVLMAPYPHHHLQLTNFSNSQDLTTDTTIAKPAISLSQDPQARTSLGDSDEGLESDDSEYPRLKCGSMELNEYTSPEEYHHEKEWSKQSLSERDIWSCGVLLFKLLTGQFPFSNDHGKLAPNKIKNATFSFPQLHPLVLHSPALGSPQFSHSFNCDFLSAQWKELLKKMMSKPTQRITLRELITHPFKEGYLQLKTTIPDLRTSHPSLTNLFGPKKAKSDDLYHKSWQVNFQAESDSDDERDQVMILKDRELNCNDQRSVSGKQKEEEARDSLGESKIFDEMRQTFASKQAKMQRLHRTQYGPQSDSQKIIENARYDSVGVSLKEKVRKQRENSVKFPLTIHTDETKSEKELLMAKAPTFIVKFKYFKKENFLGYILDNGVGVVFPDGEHIIGHTNKSFKYIEEVSQIDSEIIGDNSDTPHNKQKNTLLKALHRPRLTPNQSVLNGDENLKGNKKSPNFMSEQVSSKDLQKNSKSLNYTQYKCTHSDLLSSSHQSLSSQKYSLYLKTIDFFGERVVKGKLNLWVDRFWIDGNIYVFLLNSGCWQVVFLRNKCFSIYAVDENGVGWAQDVSQPPDMLYKVRQIIAKTTSMDNKK